MTYADPWYFLFFIILFLACVVYWWRRQKLRSTVKFSQIQNVKKVSRGLKAQFHFMPDILKIMALCFLIFALARPQEAETREKRNVEGIDIMIALDVSDSMLIEDMKPENRLEASKETIRKFIEKRISDRIGLVVFSGESYTRVPLTLDYPLLLQNLSQVKTTRNIKMGTAIGVALANSAGRLRDSKAKTRIIIFLTDGENNSGTIDPVTALSVAKDFGIKIYSVGMGRDGQARLPVFVQDARGNRIKQYRPMHSKVNEPLLRRFAKETGGKFWRATTGENLEDIFKEIDSLETTEIETRSYTRYHEKYDIYLWWSLILYGFSFVLRHTVLRRAYG